MVKKRELAGVLALMAAMLLSGCGQELINTGLRISQTGTNALPDWTWSARMGLGEKDVVLGDLLKGSKDLPLTEGQDHSYTLFAPTAPIATVSFAQALSIPAQNPTTIPAPPIPDPDLGAPITLPDLSVADLGIMDMSAGTFDIPLVGNVTLTVGDAIASPLIPADQKTMRTTLPFDMSKGAATNLGSGETQLRGAEMASGSELVLHIENQIGQGTDGNTAANQSKLPISLSNIRVVSNGSDLNAMWRVDHPKFTIVGTTEIHVGLDEDARLAKNLVVTFDVHGEVQAGFPLTNVDDSQAVKVRATPQIRIKSISLPRNDIPATNQTIPVALPDNLGIKELGDIKIATGSIVMHVENTFGVNIALNVAMAGVLDSQGASFSHTVYIPGTQDGSPVIRDLPVSLDGATLRMRALGAASPSISVSISGNTVDTEKTGMPFIPQELALPRGLAFYHMTNHADPTDLGQYLHATVKVNEMKIDSISARITRTQDLPAQDTPISLPSQFTDLGITPQKISLKLQLNNKSLMPGTVNLDMQVKKRDGTYAALQLQPTYELKPALARGLTQENVIAITDQNSDIIDWLGQGISGLKFAGSVVIDSKDQFVSITQDDAISGEVAFSLPLVLKFSPIGQDGAKPYDLDPIKVDESMRSSFNQPAVDRIALYTSVTNGFKIPLVLNLLISKTDTPYTDPDALALTLALGDGTAVQESVLDFDSVTMAQLKAAKNIGIRITSPGTPNPVTLMSTDRLQIKLMAKLGLRPKAAMTGGK